MATELKGTTARNGKVSVTRFSGRTDEGRCVQLTPEFGETFLSLDKPQALELAEALLQFANGTREEI
jgi:hypothetical protein